MTRLEDQLKQEKAEKALRESEKPTKAEDEKLADLITEERQDEATKCDPSEAEKLENVQNQIKRLRADQELKAVQDGYKSYQDAVIQLSKTREQLEADRAKLPNILEREKLLLDKESDIDQRVTLAEQYSAEKHAEGNDYFISRRKDGDAHYKTAMDNFVREYNEKNEILKRITEELQKKIDICNENAEPIGLLMAKDSRLIYNYLTNFIFPILDNGTLKLFGVFNGKLELLRQQAKLLHDSLYTDALRLLKTAEEIKEK